jgi:putative flippase GtrA
MKARGASGLLARVNRFAVLSAISFATNVATIWALVQLGGASEELAVGLSLAVIFVFNFAMMRAWVYEGRSFRMGARRQLLACAITSACFRVGEWTAFALLFRLIGLHYLATFALVAVASFLIKFGVYDRLVFHGAQARDEEPPRQ